MANVKITEKPMDKACACLHHKATDCHVLVLEADLPIDLKENLICLSEKARCFSNHLRHIFNGHIKELFRTRNYRSLSQRYQNLKNSKDKKKRDELNSIAKEMLEMQSKHHLTMTDVVEEEQKLYKRYEIPAVFALTLAEDVWSGIKKVLYSDGKSLRYHAKDRLISLRSKQYNNAILFKVKEGDLFFTFNRKTFGYLHRKEDTFQQEEVAAIVNWLENKETIERNAGLDYVFYRKKTNTHRPCFATFVFKEIRGKIRVYVHITVEGPAFAKKRKDGTLRHSFGKGVIGCDIGTQTIAYVSPEEVGLKNLAERGPSIRENERKQKLINRKMARSRIMMNPENFNQDGTVRKGHKVWKESNRYKKLRIRHRDLCRKNAVNRKLSIKQDLNQLRSSGHIFITEPPNAKKLKKRSKGPIELQDKVSVIKTKDGKTKTIQKYKRKKRFGRSVQNRCPGTFQAEAKRKFPVYIEVPSNYKASQFDHTNCKYVKHKLSERMLTLSDGSIVQRDLYSAFLLSNYLTWGDYAFPDPDGCEKSFTWFQKQSNELINFLKDNQIEVKNSGIRF